MSSGDWLSLYRNIFITFFILVLVVMVGTAPGILGQPTQIILQTSPLNIKNKSSQYNSGQSSEA
jgi:hypothetical protein